MNTNISNLNRGKNLASVRRQSGFTLIELVIVLAVLGALAAIAVPQLTGLQKEAELAGTATTISSEVGSAFAKDLLDGDTSLWAAASVCGNIGTTDDDSTITVPSLAGYSIDGSDNDGDQEVTVPTYNGEEVDSKNCYITKT